MGTDAKSEPGRGRDSFSVVVDSFTTTIVFLDVFDLLSRQQLPNPDFYLLSLLVLCLSGHLALKIRAFLLGLLPLGSVKS